jgi:hypothetical protein
VCHYIYSKDKLREIKMKKVVLSLIIGGLSISGDCFAVAKNFDKGSDQRNNAALQQVKGTWSKVKSNTKKVLGNKKVQVAAIGTAAVVGTAGAAVAAYYYSPSFAGFINSNAKVIANYGSNASKIMSSYGSRASESIRNYGSSASKIMSSYRSRASESIRAFLEIKPASTKWEQALNTVKGYLGGKPAPVIAPTGLEKFVGGVKNYAGSAWNSYAQPCINKTVSVYNSTPTWAKVAGVAGAGAAGYVGYGLYVSYKFASVLTSF